jgi:hypothetical protein
VLIYAGIPTIPLKSSANGCWWFIGGTNLFFALCHILAALLEISLGLPINYRSKKTTILLNGVETDYIYDFSEEK